MYGNVGKLYNSIDLKLNMCVNTKLPLAESESMTSSARLSAPSEEALY